MVINHQIFSVARHYLIYNILGTDLATKIHFIFVKYI